MTASGFSMDTSLDDRPAMAAAARQDGNGPRVIVIGSGIAGLTAAYRLGQA
jgi:oxygen-dependent protoporphyrinogen oxidase